jgi:DNA polymerase V
MTPAVVRKNFTLMLERNVLELNGEACIFLEEAPPTKQQIVYCRSFGERIRTYESLRQDICQYAEGAAENLHGKIQFCRHISFPQDLSFRHQLGVIWQRGQREATLLSSSCAGYYQCHAKALDSIWIDGLRYAKAGVMLWEDIPISRIT